MAEQKALNYIDLFAGAGGLSLGLHNAGLRGIFAIEKNKDAFATLKHNLIDVKNHFDWPEWLPQTPHDICELVKNYETELRMLNNHVDLIVGGPPCQGFSMAGLRNYKDVRNSMVKHYLKIVEFIRPTYVLFENVHGFTLEFKDDHKKKPYSQIVIEKLKKLKYSVKTKEVLMSDFGVPQKRVRFILVGSLKNDIDDYFDKLNGNRNVFFKSKNLKKTSTIEEAIGDLLQEYGTYRCPDCKQNFSSGVYGSITSLYQVFMRKNANCKPNSHRFAKHTNDILDLHKKMLNTVIPNKRISPADNLIKGLKRRGVTLLSKDGISPTITSSPDELVHYCEPRILTVRELARLQSFPDWYEFKGKYTSGGQLRKIDVPRYTQVANAVPPLFAEQLGIVFGG
jgi:DNA (cytosine-5)-methyltransferase 1